jgi:hypothetical protein
MEWKTFDAMMKEKDLRAKKIFCSPLYFMHDGIILKRLQSFQDEFNNLNLQGVPEFFTKLSPPLGKFIIAWILTAAVYGMFPGGNYRIDRRYGEEWLCCL